MFRKLAGLTAIAGLFIAGTASAQIVGSAHDFSGQGYSGGEICVVCHAPHNTNATVADEAPLWNHALASAAAFTMYSSVSLDGAIAAEPNTASLLCLSCHDGQTALDAFGGSTGTGIVISGPEAMGVDLGNDHPISVTYTDTTATADGSMALPETDTPANLGGATIQAALMDGGTTVECSSCHNVHREAGLNVLLRISNAGSALCQTCHSK